MEKIRQFLIGTKTASRVLFVLWIVFSATCNFANESKLLEIFDFIVIFLFPAIVNELCKNPLFQEKNSSFFKFIRNTRVTSRVLLQMWAFTGLLGAGSIPQNFLYTFPIMAVVFLLPAIIIELKKNPIWNKRVTSSNNDSGLNPEQSNMDPIILKENTEKTPKYISKSRITSFVLFGFTVLFLIIGLSANSNKETYSANNMSPGIVFAIITVVVFIISLFSPKTKDEEIQRKQQRKENYKKPLPTQTVGGIILCTIGGFLSIDLLMPVFAITEEGFFATAGKEGIAVGFVMGLCGLLLLILGICYLQGKFVDSALARKEQKIYARRMRPYRGIYLTEEQIHNLENKIGLPVLDTPVFLHSGEVAVYHSQATRQETKTRVIGRTGSYGGGTVRIAKGLSIHSGGSSSSPIYGDVSMQYPGEFIITNERIIFLSNQKGFELKHQNITAATAYKDGFAFQSQNASYVLLVPRADLATLAFDGIRTGEIPITGIDASDDYDYDDYDEIDSDDIASIDGMEGHDFEYFCADLLRRNGFSEVSVTKGSGDQGVDVLATKGGIKYAIQCKNYASALGNTPVQEVNAGKTFYNCHVGVVMTNSTFTSGAKTLAQATGVLLWDRATLQKLMEDAE